MPDDSKNFGFCHLKWCFLLFVLHVPVCTAFDEQLDNFHLTLLAGQVQWSVLKVHAYIFWVILSYFCHVFCNCREESGGSVLIDGPTHRSFCHHDVVNTKKQKCTLVPPDTFSGLTIFCALTYRAPTYFRPLLRPSHSLHVTLTTLPSKREM